MKKIQLKNIDPLEIEDLLLKVEESFGIEFFENELLHVKTFGEFCNHIENKIRLQNISDCTYQQAFYKLRVAFSEILAIEQNQIYPNLLIKEIITKKNKKKVVEQLEDKIGFELDLLNPPDWLLTTLLLIFIGSIVMLFIDFKFGVSGIAFSVLGFWIANKFATDFKLKTLGQVAKKMASVNYLKSRRNPKTFNKNEINRVLTDLFATELFLDKSKLQSETTFK